MAVTDLPEPDSPTTAEHLAAVDVEASRRCTACTRPSSVLKRMARSSTASSGFGLPSLFLHVERVTQAVADQQEGQHGEHDGRCPGTSSRCGAVEKKLCDRSIMRPSDGVGLLHAHAEERQRRLGQHGASRCPTATSTMMGWITLGRMWRHMMRQPRDADGPGRLDVLELLGLQEAGPHDAGRGEPRREGEGEDHGADAPADAPR